MGYEKEEEWESPSAEWETTLTRAFQTEWQKEPQSAEASESHLYSLAQMWGEELAWSERL